jgi:hypothetical protein
MQVHCRGFFGSPVEVECEMPIYDGRMFRVSNLLLVLLLAVASVAAGISAGVHAQAADHESVSVADTHSGPAGAYAHTHDSGAMPDECSAMSGHCIAEAALPSERVIHVAFGEVVRRLAVGRDRWGNAILCADPPPPRA